jgi:Ran GTPase-activating protein (RanGAP) involved in mRNA processing and transport
MQFTMLSHIYIAGNFIGNKGIKILAEGLAHNDRVMALDLTNNDITSEGAHSI